MAQKFKKNKGNKYAHDAEFADEVIAKNAKMPGQQKPSEGIRKNY
ncbi:hypothetical protein NV379_16210 [Paenibacillus sp. N1-5-1-14]|nr:hypothetical protein [Paenibacillus radicibacter]MCR8644198.1 hypothetical protein [Paenibacillus radicibacter]